MSMIIRSAKARTATAIGALAACACVGAAGSPVTEIPAVAGHPAAAATVAAMGSGDTDAASAAFPSDFGAAMHYRPIRDLGYDLLRFAGDSGAELRPDARRALDRNLTRDLRTACAAAPDADPGCAVVAEVASVAVRINSWRQQYRPPSPESPLPILLGLGAALVVGVAGLRVRS